jgi:1-deoxy-D-xylulose-5-phosphate synthase
VLEALAAADVMVPVRVLAIPDRLIEHGDPAAILAELGLDAAGISAGAQLVAGDRR